jgi:hypothetical protein
MVLTLPSTIDRLILTHMSQLLGIVPPSPACKRALKMVVDALKDSDGHEVVDL